MKVLLVVANPPYDRIFGGGGVVMIRNVAKRFAERGHEFHVLSEKRGNLKDTEVIGGVYVHRYSFLNMPKIRAFTNPLALSSRIKRIIEKYKIDVLIANGIWYDGYVCAKISKDVGIPFLLIVHCPLSSMPVFNGIFKKKAWFTIRSCDKIMTVSKMLKRDAINNFSIKPRTIFVNYHGIESEFLNAKISKRERAEVKRSFGLSESHPIVTCVSRFAYPQKRQDILIRSCKEILKEYPKLKMVFVGRGDSLKCRRLSEELGLDTHTLFLETISNKDVIRILSASDIFAFPTAFEGFGLVTIEAMAMGLPVVASNISPLDEIIKDGFDGKLVGNSPKSFSEGIISLLKDKKQVAYLSRNAKNSAKGFDWDKTADRLEKELKSTLRVQR
jgi:teichuronic acid biosynthesis glycosyltransferase TuaC